jgi:hypothetical protein
MLNKRAIIGAFPRRPEGLETCPCRMVCFQVQAIGDVAKAIFQRPLTVGFVPRLACQTFPGELLPRSALGLKSSYTREMHLTFCPSRQVVEVAHIFSALRAHHKPPFST